MKKIILSVLAVGGMLTAMAQVERHPMPGKHPGPGKHLPPHHMRAPHFQLSEEQKQKAKTLNEDFRKNMMELRKKDDITVKEWRTRMVELQKKHRENMQNLLSKDQKDRMEKMKTERKKMAEIDAHARLEKMKLRFGLTNEQTEKLKSQRVEMMEKMKALHENKSMDMLKKRKEMKMLMEKRKQSLKSILTEEQMKKIQELNHPGPPHRKRKVLS